MEQAVSELDWQRMLIGDDSAIVFVEILIRTVIIYGYTLALLRWLGGRAIGQLSTVEFLLVIALGSAVGDAMFYPDVPLLHAMAVVTLVVLANKGLDMAMARNRAFERALDGAPKEAVRQGVILASFLKDKALTTNELAQQLRQRGIEHLGQVEHAYVETDGVLTVFKSAPQARPGLPIVPPWEIEHPRPVAADASPDGPVACLHCGYLAQPAHRGTCPNCGGEQWTLARTDR
ncbi:YetF domain-containing protein [Devosia sp. SD17-2]|jgi:uncharacterized membrane protein YcaP (DUF421 family)|uniref:YetF domain-containing protein n=1 Tax=Devosia sp. SD17-2 TaxID=2976459 RepID=UPI0023D8528C|nr:YetF domain-containing protein [Devosia sp. SD17-2]WEJ33190.1 DUF421 domain-containing protein [Devosia sp. SD17-2]